MVFVFHQLKDVIIFILVGVVSDKKFVIILTFVFFKCSLLFLDAFMIFSLSLIFNNSILIYFGVYTSVSEFILLWVLWASLTYVCMYFKSNLKKCLLFLHICWIFCCYFLLLLLQLLLAFEFLLPFFLWNPKVTYFRQLDIFLLIFLGSVYFLSVFYFFFYCAHYLQILLLFFNTNGIFFCSFFFPP